MRPLSRAGLIAGVAIALLGGASSAAVAVAGTGHDHPTHKGSVISVDADLAAKVNAQLGLDVHASLCGKGLTARLVTVEGSNVAVLVCVDASVNATATADATAAADVAGDATAGLGSTVSKTLGSVLGAVQLTG